MIAVAEHPYRADHVGSLLRPPELHQARADAAAGRISPQQLRLAEDEAIRSVVRMQEEVGLRSATDGEFRRSSWHMDYIYQLGGVSRAEENLAVKFRNESGGFEFTSAALKVHDRVRLDAPIFVDDFRFLQSTVRSVTPKLTISYGTVQHGKVTPL